jgi:hypothetical protein
MRIFRFACGVCALAVAPTLAQAAQVISYSDLLPPVQYSIAGSQTGFDPFNMTIDTSKDQPFVPLAETTGGVSANADLLFVHPDPSISIPDPQVSVSATPSLQAGQTVIRYGASATVTIYFSVFRANLPPDQQPASIQVDVLGKFFGGGPHSGASVTIQDIKTGVNKQIGTDQSGDTTPFDLTMDVIPNDLYEVNYEASAGGCLAANPIETCGVTQPGGPYIAGIDPVLMIDPALAANGDYVLEMSAALAPSNAAPEPSTWALMTLGFGALGLVGYRASRRTQPTA